uniref:Uncharacterized protein n=1 Tax=Triticum urartu TaxID=4572 RepID=A0A8R7K132_TRIUA
MAKPSHAGAGVTILRPTTYSCTAPPLPHSPLPCAPVARSPPMVRPYQYGECGKDSPAAAAAWIRSRRTMPLSTVMSCLSASMETVRFSRVVLMIVPSLPPGHASLGPLCECLVATFILRLADAAAATAATSSCSVLG